MTIKNKTIPRAILIFSILTSLVWLKQARAEPDPVVPELQLSLGGDAVFGFWSMVCDVSSDWVGCPSQVLMPSAQLGGMYRIGRLALGGLGSFGVLRNSEVTRAFMWRAAVDGRYYTPLGRVVEQWISLELGVVGAHSATKVVSMCCGPVTDPEHSIGPEIGAGAGFDFKIGKYFALGLSVRALWLIFIGPDDPDTSHSLQLNRTIWFSGGAHVRFSFPV